MHYINWSDFITDELINRIFIAANVNIEPATVDDIKAILLSILNATGGFPIFDAVPDANAKTATAVKLLEEACRHTIASLGFHPNQQGLLFDKLPDNQIFNYELKANPQIDVNIAHASEFVDLEGIGETLATRIIDERRNNGPFVSMTDLAERIKGFGAELADDYRHIFSFVLPADSNKSIPFDVTSYEDYYRILQSQFNFGSPKEELLGLFDIVATNSSLPKHPEVLDPFLPRGKPTPQQIDSADAQWVGVLANTSYYNNLPQIIAGASNSIDLCMFHISFPNEAHPTRTLLDALIAAQAKGVTVRVIADQDRENDPYNSTVINLPALRYLIQNGVACKVDAESELLHSKYMLIDSHIVVIGSHNWSAGSYFQFNDHSLVIESPSLATTMGTRFNNLWLNGSSIDSINPF